MGNCDITIDATGKVIITEYPTFATVPKALAGYTVVPDFRLPTPPASPITRLVSTAHALLLRKIRELTIFATAENSLRRLGLPTSPDAVESEARRLSKVMARYS
jgi:hypothetical protein